MKNKQVMNHKKERTGQLFHSTLSLVGCFSLLGMSNLPAQESLPQDLEKSYRQQLSAQAKSFAAAAAPLAQSMSKNVVSIQFRDKLLAYGTVTEQGILTKWSELQPFLRYRLAVVQLVKSKKEKTASVQSHPLRVLQIFKEHDLVLLQNPIKKAKGVSFSQKINLELGDFLIMVGMQDQVAGFGVTSVAARSLREQDRGFLGVGLDFREWKGKGARIISVARGSSAERFGLRLNDYLLKINDNKIGSTAEAINLIQQFKPGEQVKFQLNRNNKVLELDVILGNRPKKVAYPVRRINTMENMGGRANAVRSGFPNVIQSDMQVKANTMGAPVINLEGEFIGISISRSRQQTFIVPADEIKTLLSSRLK